MKLMTTFFCVTAVLLSALLGCGPAERASVSGTVQMADGTPVGEVQVIATSAATGRTVYGSTDAVGKFKLISGNVGEDILPGDYNVVVMKKVPRGDQTGPAKKSIPMKYSRAETSGLKFSVEAGETKDLVLVLDLT